MIQNGLKEPKVLPTKFPFPSWLLPSTSLIRTFALTSAPFIDKILRLFVWQPSQGVFSFCQRLAGSICGHGRSKDKMEKLGADLDESTKAAIHSALDDSQGASVFDLDESQREYGKAYLRFKEKQDFLEHLTGNTPSHFLDYMGQTLPLLLNELQKAVSLSQLVSKFFELFQNIVDSFPNETHTLEVQEKIISDLVYHITQFMNFFYAVIHYTSSVKGTPKELPIMTSIFEFIFGMLMRMDVPAYDGTETGGYHEEVVKMVESLNTEEKEALWAYIHDIEEKARNGMDDRHWSNNDTILKVFVPHLRSQFQK
jgi:hypothetical protein